MTPTPGTALPGDPPETWGDVPEKWAYIPSHGMAIWLGEEFTKPPDRPSGDWCRLKLKDRWFHQDGYAVVMHPVHGRIMVKL